MSYRERKVNSNGTYSQYVHQTGSDVQQPVDIQSRYQQTIQTHNAVSVAANGSSESSRIDTNGFDKVAVTMLSDSGIFNNSIALRWSNDNSSDHGYEIVLASGQGSQRTVVAETKARYLKVVVINSDAAAHVMSAWAYLKA